MFVRVLKMPLNFHNMELFIFKLLKKIHTSKKNLIALG